MDKAGDKKRLGKGVLWSSLATTLVVIAAVGLFTANLAPFRAFGGAIWFKRGVHYFSNGQISNRVEQLNAPKEAAIAKEIGSSTPSCDNLEGGYCQRSEGDYVYKTLVTPGFAYSPGPPDTKQVIGYCTLCNDGTFSPSCAVGRGACSYHSGVQSHNVAEYRTIPGTQAVQAQPAVYSYAPKSYQDNPSYNTPETPSLNTVVGF